MDQLVQGDCQGDNRSWDNKCYFFPIMQDEIEKNNKLIQNPGYQFRVLKTNTNSAG